MLTRAPPPQPPSPPPAIEVEELAAPPPPAGTPPDRSPPVISLNGEAVVRVRVYRPYADAGASAVDDRDGPVAVAVRGLPIDTSQVSGDRPMGRRTWLPWGHEAQQRGGGGLPA